MLQMPHGAQRKTLFSNFRIKEAILGLEDLFGEDFNKETYRKMVEAVPLRTDDITVLEDVDHVLLRPARYTGSTSEELIWTYVYEEGRIVGKEVLYTPALLKLFDEIVTNSVDEAIRTGFSYANKISVKYDASSGTVRVEDNGRGLPIEFDEKFQKWSPEKIFGLLKAGSNFDDEANEEVAGQNGEGGSLAAMFSERFYVETCNGARYYRQEMLDHTRNMLKPKIRPMTDRNFTHIEYTPDLSYFSMADRTVNLANLGSVISKRVKDLAFAYPEIAFKYNGERIYANNLRQFLAQVHQVFESNEVQKARIGVFYSETEFQQISFVNGADCKRGGTHVAYIKDNIVNHVREFLRKKHKLDVKPIDISSKLFIFFSMRMKNPRFDGQTKEYLQDHVSTKGIRELLDSILTPKFLNSILKNDEIILPIVEAYKLKEQALENVAVNRLNSDKKKVKAEKYYPATKENKYLVLSEGDSAGFSLMAVLGREEFGFFTLRGKPMNTLECELKKVIGDPRGKSKRDKEGNAEFKNLFKILGMKVGSEDTDIEYQYPLIASDADADGSHIRALLLCFFLRFGPGVLKANRVKFLRTPVVAGYRKGKIEKYFFDLDSFKAHTSAKGNGGLEWVYKKGLGSWRKEDLIQLIQKEGIDHFIRTFEFTEESETMIRNWMSGETVEFRKVALRSKSFNVNRA
jgi:DNA topoisomerase-2